MKVTNTPTGTLLQATDGKWLTDGTTYCTEVKLAPTAKATDWHEVDTPAVPTEQPTEQQPLLAWGQNL